jgi:hypothetical protein
MRIYVSTRIMGLFAIVLLSSGCAVLDNIDFNAPPHYDPTRVYLVNESFTVRRSADLGRYTCLSAPLACSLAGGSWHCVCP